jgi:Transglycosylase SLT domain/SPOR domain
LRHFLTVLIGGLFFVAHPAPVRAAEGDGSARDQPVKAEANVETICATIQAAAGVNDLPIDFFTRLIWQESRFDPQAVSPAGAQGIAQFMPATAAWRGLGDPFDPLESLRESAEYLRDMRARFGNLGLAAAAYNAGPRRVRNWLAKRGSLPDETQAYVRIITGRDVDDWVSGGPRDLAATAAPPVPCPEIAKVLVEARRRAIEARRQAPASDTKWAPWGVQLAANVSESRALAGYERLRRQFAAILRDREPLLIRSRVPGRGRAYRHLVRIAADTRQGAEQLCSRLELAGASCAVLRNPPPVLVKR